MSDDSLAGRGASGAQPPANRDQPEEGLPALSHLGVHAYCRQCGGKRRRRPAARHVSSQQMVPDQARWGY